MRQASKRSRIRAGLIPAYVAGTVASERIWTLATSTRVTGGIKDDLLVRVHPRSASTHVPRSRLTLSLLI